MRHKLLAGIIPFCSGKRKPSTFTSSSLTDCNHITTNNNMLHSKSTYFYRWSSRYISIAPIACALTLLVGIGLLLNPTTKAQEVYAATNDDKCMNGDDVGGVCPMELSLTMSGTNGTGAYEEAGATQLEVGKTSYRAYDFKVSATDIDKDGYKLYATAVETKLGETNLTNQLVNADYPDKETFIPISTAEGVVGENITAGQWGYAIAGGGVDSILPTVDTANTNPGSLTYKAVPTNQTTPIATGTETTTTDSGIPDNPATVPDEYRLVFGAKANEGMASGHYRTQVMLSLVADPKRVGGLGGVQYMSEFTSAICKSLPTPSATAALKDVPAGQLVDDREGVNGTKYWVSKLADGACWMTQNMAYSGISNTDGYFNSAKKNTLLVPNNVNNPTSYTEKPLTDLKDYTLSVDSTMTIAYDDITKTYNGHYLVGNFYTQEYSRAADACTFRNNADWKLPTASSISVSGVRGSFGRLLGAYSVENNAAGSIKISKAPFYFLYAGHYNGSYFIGSYGRYWSSTSGKLLLFGNGEVKPNASDGSGSSISVRCVVSGS